MTRLTSKPWIGWHLLVPRCYYSHIIAMDHIILYYQTQHDLAEPKVVFRCHVLLSGAAAGVAGTWAGGAVVVGYE
jgi:hypothetical protein